MCIDDPNFIGTCTEVQPGCFKVSAETECPGAQICSAGACVCPTTPTGNVVGGACSPAQTQTCSDDGRAVLTCVSDAQACLVWTVAVPAADQCDLADGTGDGLTCESNQCVCPNNNTSIFYANPAVDRDARPGLVRNGRRFPAICSFDTMTLALAAASSPNFALTGIAVAASDDPEIPGIPAVFDGETFPWIIPSGRIMTSTDDPVSGVGGTGNWAPQNFVVVVNNDAETEDASVNVQGAGNRATRGGSLRGLTLVEGTCDGDTCGLSPIALDIEDHGVVASSFNALNFVVVEGGGGSFAQGDEDGVLAGDITATVSGDSVTLSITGNATAFNGLDASSDFHIGVTGSADPTLNGFFLVESFTDGDTVVVRNPDATDGATFTGTLTLIGAHDWTTGIRVTNSNATLNQLLVRNFSTFGAGNRIGLLVESDFDGDAPDGTAADVVAILGGRFTLNDTGISVDGPDDDDLNVSIGPAAGPTPTSIDNSLSVGLSAEDGNTAAAGLIATATSADGAGNGIVVTGDAAVSLSGVQSSGNANHGVAYESGTLVDTGSTFATNGTDGVNVDLTLAAKPQVETEGDVTLNGTSLTDNGQHGLNVVGDGLLVVVNGGAITLNDEDGINMSAESLLVTNASPAGNLEIDSNAESGIEATEGEVRLNSTNINLNGTANVCTSGVPGEDLASMAVIIGGNASMHATGIDVSTNRGGGIDIGTAGDGRPNTVASSNIAGNGSIDTCFSGETDPASGPGILVRAASSLQFVNAASVITGNAGVGLYVAGTVNEAGLPRDEPVSEVVSSILVTSNAWTGLFVAASGSVVHTGGTVNSNGVGPQGTSFNDGAHIEGAYTSTNTEYASNAGDGLIVNIADEDVAMLTNPIIRANSGNGVNILGAGGSGGGSIDTLGAVTDAEYGFLIRTTPGSSSKVQVFNNVGDGFRLGDAAQVNDILAKIGDVSIHNNGGAGIRSSQHADQAPEDACGGEDGCTGVTILSNDIFSNTGGGINLGTSFIKRLVGGAEQRGFAANDIFHNALATCGGPQTASQIVVNGATGLAQGFCDDAGNQDEGNCFGQNDPSPGNTLNDNPGVNNQCLWTGSECVVAWDLGPGATEASCNVANQFRDYIRDGAPNANSEGAIFATSGARVLANRNNWPNGSAVQGRDITVSADAGTFIRAELACGATSLTCNEPPAP